jgi:hypothetical protein
MIDGKPLPHGTKVPARLKRNVFTVQRDDFLVTLRAAIMTGAIPFFLPIAQATDSNHCGIGLSCPQPLLG